MFKFNAQLGLDDWHAETAQEVKVQVQGAYWPFQRQGKEATEQKGSAPNHTAMFPLNIQYAPTQPPTFPSYTPPQEIATPRSRETEKWQQN